MYRGCLPIDAVKKRSGASAQIVVKAPDSESLDDATVQNQIEQLATRIGDVDGVAQALSPYDEYSTDAISDNRSTGIVQVQFDEQSDSVTDATIEAVKEAAGPTEDAGLTVAFGGSVFQNLEYGITVTELLGVAFAALVLLVTFCSLIAADSRSARTSLAAADASM